MKTIKKFLAIMLSLILCINLGVAALGASYEPDADGTVTVSGVTSVPSSTAYYNNNVKKVVIEEGVTSIGTYAFSECANLTEVHLPVSLSEVKSGAFGNCAALTTVYYAGTEAQRANISFASYTSELQNANWIYQGSESGGNDSTTEPDTGDGTDTPSGGESQNLSISIAGTTVIAGETATVEIKLASDCTRLGAQLKLSAADSAGNKLEISSVTLGVDGASNDNNDGTIVLASDNKLVSDTVLATVSFKTVSAGSYTLSLEGDIYTGEDNAKAEWTLSAGKITVKEPTVNVTWLNADGTKLDEQTVDIGSTPVYGGDTPTKASDRLYNYTFSSWDKAAAAVYTDTVYTAQFSKSARTYSVTIDCGIDGAEYSITNSNGVALSPAADGSFTLIATETYTCSITAVGCIEKSITISVSDESADWNISESSAVLNIESPAAHIGDVDDSGNVDIRDAQALYSYLAGNINVGSDGIAYSAAGAVVFNSNVADINDNGSIGADDILPMLDLISE